jgi:ABC-type multidrug transport system fused ATPase/permease subunit
MDRLIVLDHGRVVEHGDRSMLGHSEQSRFHHLLELAMADTQPQAAGR